jgi:RNA:NAD 2'-phosphotransferase (TPT1/KptA family)
MSEQKQRRFTDEVLSDEMAEILRRKTPGERLQMALNSWTFIRDLIRSVAAQQHPEWTEEELNRHVAERMSRGTG